MQCIDALMAQYTYSMYPMMVPCALGFIGMLTIAPDPRSWRLQTGIAFAVGVALAAIGNLRTRPVCHLRRRCRCLDVREEPLANAVPPPGGRTHRGRDGLHCRVDPTGRTSATAETDRPHDHSPARARSGDSGSPAGATGWNRVERRRRIGVGAPASNPESSLSAPRTKLVPGLS